jgi:hypothetical protein
MRRIIILVVSVVALFISCKQSKEKKEYVDSVENTEIITHIKSVEGYTLMKNYCYVCHNPNAVSHDSILAPPFTAVKRRYSMQYDNKEEFVTAMVSWIEKPSEEKALMRGAVNKFKVMPPLPLEKEILQKIAIYIYDNDVEQPKWFEEHFNEMQAKGMNMKKN